MKTVKLTSDELSIPIIIKQYVTFEVLLKIVSDLVFHGKLDLSESKSIIIKEVRGHLRWQGLSVYDDWYEDTEKTPIINDIYVLAEPILKKLFTELNP